MKYKLYMLLRCISLLLTLLSLIFSIDNFIPKYKSKILNIYKDNRDSKEYIFKFENLQNQITTLKMRDDKYSFSNIKQPIVIVMIFSTWCPPCRGQIPHLTNLQKRFKKELFMIGAVVHDDIKDINLEKFIKREKVLFFISKNQKERLRFSSMIAPKLGLTDKFPMPLMIIFFKGKYFTHYEGTMPEEMIESDIEQLLLKINN